MKAGTGIKLFKGVGYGLGDSDYRLANDLANDLAIDKIKNKLMMRHIQINGEILEFSRKNKKK